jgi:hypothetical protein
LSFNGPCRFSAVLRLSQRDNGTDPKQKKQVCVP